MQNSLLIDTQQYTAVLILDAVSMCILKNASCLLNFSHMGIQQVEYAIKSTIVAVR